MLSTQEFADWSKKYVVYLHLTTKIASDTHQGLLAAKGGRGFPYLAYLNSDGAVLGLPSGRNIDGFSSGADKAAGIQAKLVGLKKKAEGGDKAAQKELVLLNLELKVYENAKALNAATEELDLTDAEKAKIAGKMVDFEVQDIMKQAQAKGRQGGQQFMIEKFYPMAKAGKRPGGKSAILYFWVFALRGAKSANDVKTFETGLQILKTHYGTGRYARMIQKMQQDLNQMKGGGGD